MHFHAADKTACDTEKARRAFDESMKVYLIKSYYETNSNLKFKPMEYSYKQQRLNTVYISTTYNDKAGFKVQL